MAEFLNLRDAIARHVRSGQRVALEGFTHLIPFAAGHEIIRQRIENLTLIRMTPDLIYDQMIGSGCASKLVFSWGGNPGVGSLHRLRDAVERGWPKPLEIEEHSHAAMAPPTPPARPDSRARSFAAISARTCGRSTRGIRSVTCPFTGEVLAAVAPHRPDVTIIHAQKADRRGNVLVAGIVGVQKEAVLAAACAIATVEEIVDDLHTEGTNAVVLPSWTLQADRARARRRTSVVRAWLLSA